MLWLIDLLSALVIDLIIVLYVYDFSDTFAETKLHNKSMGSWCYLLVFYITCILKNWIVDKSRVFIT